MDTKLKKHIPLTNHPVWNHDGERVDLREISDTKAKKLIAGGFNLLAKIEDKDP
tara:strand:- start:37957 stop:38118 length:162 start_codon:yes stop_codon:yes gene_type:complete